MVNNNISSLNQVGTQTIQYSPQVANKNVDLTSGTANSSTTTGSKDGADLSPAAQLQQRIEMLEQQKSDLESKLAAKKEEFGGTLDAKTRANGGVPNSENMNSTQMAAAIDAKNRANNINENTGEGNRINNEIMGLKAQLEATNQQISMLRMQRTETTNSPFTQQSAGTGIEGINTKDTYTPWTPPTTKEITNGVKDLHEYERTLLAGRGDS